MRLASALVAITLVLSPVRAFAGPSAKQRASVTVDTSGVGEAGPIIQRRIDERADVVLRDAEVLPSTDASDPLIRIDVQEVTGEDPGYAFELWVERDGRTLGERRRVECNLCTETEIVAKAEKEITTVVAMLSALVREDESDDPVASSSSGEKSPTPTTADDTTGRRPLGPKGKAGVALLATGLVGAGVGIGLAIPGWEPDENDPTKERSTRPLGLGLVGGGGALILVGAILLGLDRRKPAKAKASARIVPSRRGVIIGISGKF